MANWNGRKIVRILRQDFHRIYGKRSSLKGDKELRHNEHLVRSSCLSVCDAKERFSQCGYEKDGNAFFDDAREFCEFSDYALTKSALDRFLRDQGARYNLSYAEIGCLIPSLTFWCIHDFSLGKCKTSSFLQSLRVLQNYDGDELIPNLSKAEQVLEQDSVYPSLDSSSKELYRQSLTVFARKNGWDERKAAVELLKQARKSVDEPLRQVGAHLLKNRKSRFYFPLMFGLFFILETIVFLVFGRILFPLLSVIPAFLSAKLLCDTIYSRCVTPRILPKIEINAENCPQTLLTVVSLLTDKKCADALLHRLDVLSHTVALSPVKVGLLLDFPSGKEQINSEESALLDYLRAEIEKRNHDANRFFCAVRKRREVKGEYRFEAFGRKQGAMIDFSRLAEGVDEPFSLVCGSFREAKYLIALDSDTDPSPQSVEKLIGFMEHPNHAPKFREEKNGHRSVSFGYGMAAPRVVADPRTSRRTFFSKIIAGNEGTELYHNPHFNLYQDLFGEGIFCGKGIIRLDLYRDLIASRFDGDPILSHDLSEGEILRCANLSDTVFFDEIPHNVLSDEKRTHRWIRGDFQNIRFLSRKETESFLFRFKIIHNLCRALFPLFCLLLLALAPVLGKVSLFLGLIWLSFPFLLQIPSFVLRWFRRYRFLHPYRDFLRIAAETLLNLALLPSRAFSALDGAMRGTYRLIRNQRILEWSTAASIAKIGGGAGDYFYRLKWQQIGFVLFFFPDTVFLGILWMMAPIFAFAISLTKERNYVGSSDVKTELAAMWRFYADFMNEENHWLPPDNYQQDPLNMVAPRTSPTNIGLGMLSCLGAYDLGLLSEERLVAMLDGALETLESLEKWNGHLYNWYDTRTCKVLSPKFVSTVDSGNFSVCLHTLRTGICNVPLAENLISRIDAILGGTDFSCLYDEKKHLFSIGFDGKENRLSESYYDLYASEARLTSYYAMMKGQIPLRHWAALGRPVDKVGSSAIVRGWSGTMFEYFMPHIFLPVYDGSFAQDMLDGIFRLQRNSVVKNIPWGISESGYYAFDASLNYQYRAFGLRKAALRRDCSFPFVVSAYSTFLAYPFYPQEAERNKQRLPKGKYGYYEAVDYRQGSENPRIVQSFMAHHVGMSFLSGVNLLRNNAMQKRFMNAEGESLSAFLCESAPYTVTRRFFLPSEEKDRWQPPEVRSERPDPEHPKVHVLQNGVIAEVLTDSGAGYLMKEGRILTGKSEDAHSPEGVFFMVRHKGVLHGASYAPLYDNLRAYRTFFERDGVSCYGNFGDFETRLSLTLHPHKALSVREFMIKNNQISENTFEYFVSLHPVLLSERDYRAHPEYQDLFLTAEYEEERKVICFCRKDQDQSQWIAVTATGNFVFDVRRDAFGRYEEVDKGKAFGIREHPLFPHLFLKGTIAIRGKGTESVRVFLAAGSSKEECLRTLESERNQIYETIGVRYGQAFDAFCHQNEIRSEDRILFDLLAARIAVPYAKTAASEKLSYNLSQRTLWKYGISGDNPVVTVRVTSDSANHIVPFLKSMILFERCGIPVDLVIVYREAGGYLTPLKTKLIDLLSVVDSAYRKRIFLLNVHSVEEYLLFQKVSQFFVNLDRGWKITEAHRSFRPIKQFPIADEPVRFALQTGRGGYGKDGSFLIQKRKEVPFRPWGLVLANFRFGTVLNENSLGYTFARNASENRITPRVPAYGYGFSGEKCYAVIRGNRYDLLSSATVEYRPYGARFISRIFDAVVETEVFLPVNLSAKILRIKVLSVGEKGLEIVYEPKIILGKTDTGTVIRQIEEDRVYYRNPYPDAYGNGVSVLFSREAKTEGNKLSFQPTEEQTSATFVLGYAEGPQSARRLADLLSSDRRIAKEFRKTKANTMPYLTLESPNVELNFFVNGFLQQQILQSRILGRAGTCQPAGAYGFRDQLQDTLCLANCNADYLKHQILRCCAHQFKEGDVLHWWHPRSKGADDGIRTRFSDDPFWLVYACAEYERITRDAGFFERKVPYLRGDPLGESETDRYFVPEKSAERDTVFRHAYRAFVYGYKTGKHGLIRFGSGDWNDGLNAVGDGGETVWGSMFALLCAERFLLLAARFGTQQDCYFLSKCATDLRNALERSAYEEGQYMRGFRKDGTPFGASPTIDLIPQAFALFCNLPNAKQALDSAYQKLWDKEEKIISLLSPPYQPNREGFPGNIAKYPPGVRENGGQYTHAGVWFVKALFEAGQTDRATEILFGINPVSRSTTMLGQKQYQAEPYVLAADVYNLPDRLGFGGWTHYTGAAGWYFKVLCENLLGIKRNGNQVSLSPAFPSDWNGCKYSLRLGNDVLNVRIERGTEKGIYEQGQKIPYVPLSGRSHEITVII